MDENEQIEQAAESVQAETPASTPQPEAEKAPTGAEHDPADEEAADEGEQTEGTDDETDDAEDKPKRRSRSTRLKEQNRALRAEVEALKRLSQAPPSPRQEEAEKPPNEADYNGDFVRYMADISAYNVRKTIREENERVSASHRERIQAVERAAMDSVYAERLEDFKKVAPDFDKVVGQVTGYTLHDAALDLIRASEKGPEIAYHLAQNPARIRELNAMSPVDAARHIGRLEERLSRPTPKRQTSAPPPVKPLAGGAAPKSQEADLAAWMKKTYG
jgi:hypothetical protein